MMIVFVTETAARASNKLGYTSLNYHHGFSGTETMIVEVATHMASKGHDVYVWGKHIVPHEDHGVKYVSDVPDPKDIDIFVPVYFLFNPDVLNIVSRLPENTLIIAWMQCILQSYMWGVANMYLQNRRVVVVAPSKFGMQQIPGYLNDRYVIPNGINPDVFSIVNDDNASRLGTWIFASCWERGGSTAARIFAKYENRKKFISAAYFAPETCPTDVDIVRLGSVSKVALRDAMLESDYFVYPLILEDTRVHHDTFGCCVLEAMACGVIVVTWKAACLPEWYSDYAVLLDPPQYTSGSAESAFGACPEMRSEASVEQFLEAIRRLDADTTAKEALREKAMRWARTMTWQRSVDMLDPILEAHLPVKDT